MKLPRTLLRATTVFLAGMVSYSPISTGVAVVTTATLALTTSSGEAQFGAVRRTSRRTSRRVTRRTNYRINTLPYGARPVVIGGGTYYYANNAYWQPMYQGGQTVYVQVIVEG